MCPNTMIGTTFGVFSTTTYIDFVEAMAYSQEAIQMNALSVSFIGTNLPGYPASNAIGLKFIIFMHLNENIFRTHFFLLNFCLLQD